ncbi:hypothetical protein ACTFIU_003432 [Dictyostelium citrinum]
MDYVPRTELEKLNELFSMGFITEWEYNNRKKELGVDDSNDSTNNNNKNINNDLNDYNNSSYSYNNNSSYNNNTDYYSNSNDYNQVIPVIQNDYQMDTTTTTATTNNNDYFSNNNDYNQVIPVLNNDFQIDTTSNNNSNNYNYENNNTYDYSNNNLNDNYNNYNDSNSYYQQQDYYNNSNYINNNNDIIYNNNINQINNNNNINNDIIYNNNNQINDNNNNYKIENIEKDDDIYEIKIKDPIIVKKNSNIIGNKNIDSEKSNKPKEYPLKVKDSYTIHKDIGNNIVLYFKDKACNYQSDLIPIKGKSKSDILNEIYKFVGLEYLKSTTVLSIFKMVINDKRIAKPSEFYNYGPTETTLIRVQFNDEELLKPNHLLIQFVSYAVHRNRWNPTTKLSSDYTFGSPTEYFKGYQGEPIKIDRKKYPYVIDKFKSDSSIPQYGFEKFKGMPEEQITNFYSPSIRPKPCKPITYKNQKIDATWLKLNFLILFRHLQTRAINDGKMTAYDGEKLPNLSKNSALEILEPLKDSINQSKCLICGDSISFGNFLCDTHYSNDLMNAFEKCKPYLFLDSNNQPIKQLPKDQLESFKENQEKKEKTVFIKEKFAYIDPSNLQSILDKKVIPYIEQNNYDYY